MYGLGRISRRWQKRRVKRRAFFFVMISVIIFCPITGGFFFRVLSAEGASEKTVPLSTSEDPGRNHTFEVKTTWSEDLFCSFLTTPWRLVRLSSGSFVLNMASLVELAAALGL